jgi:hypothetical protein
MFVCYLHELQISQGQYQSVLIEISRHCHQKQQTLLKVTHNYTEIVL